MGFKAGNVIVRKGGKVGRINAGVDLRGLDPKHAEHLFARLSSWQLVGGTVDVSGTVGDVNTSLQVSFNPLEGSAALETLRKDLAAIHTELADLASDDTAPEPIKKQVKKVAQDLADAKAESEEPEPDRSRLEGRVKSAADTMKRMVEVTESGTKLAETGTKAWTVIRDNWPRLLILWEMAKHLSLPKM